MTTEAASSNNLFGNLMQTSGDGTSTPATITSVPEGGNGKTPVVETETETVQVDQLDMLKNRAKLMGITFSNNISAETLRARIKEKLAEDQAQQDAAEALANQAPAVTQQPEPAFIGSQEVLQLEDQPVAIKPAAINPRMTLRQQILAENMKLVRLRITNLDPKKKDLHGEIITVANEYIGTVKKFVPFGEQTDDGYHVPYCIYKMMKRRQFQQIRTRKHPRTGIDIAESRWVREFALEVLPRLTEAEIARLAAAQAAAGLNDD